MENKMAVCLKRLLMYLCIAVFVLCTTSCSFSKENKQSAVDQQEVVTDVSNQTVFDREIIYLTEKGLQLPDLSPANIVNGETFLTLLVEAYESLGHEIDISKVNPDYEVSDAVKKMTLIGTYDSYVMDVDLSSDLEYGSGAYWLLKLQDAIQKRLYSRSDAAATTGDLIRRINVSTALHTWTQDAAKVRTYAIGDLLEGEAVPNQHLTRLMAAEMMVSAYEDTIGEIKLSQTFKPTDTEDINAWKSNQFFFWPESGMFEPEKTGNWDDWSFMSAIVYDSQLRLGGKLEESKVPYGSAVAALATLLKAYEGIEQKIIEEKIVLNERPYDWHVNQQDSGEYSDVNCMPSCVVMAMKYQGLSDPPSAEKLREDNPLDGLGWNDVLAEKVMQQYGLKFTDSFEVNLDKMLDLLDKGNILYVMYWDSNSQVGHSVIIKGYWKLVSNVNFIVSDPNNDMTGPFGYIEYVKDAQTMLADIESHVPRYFIIPKKE